MNRRTPLFCRLGRHAPTKILHVRHLMHPTDLRGLKQPGSVVTYRCGRCGARWRRANYAYFWRLKDVVTRL